MEREDYRGIYHKVEPKTTGILFVHGGGWVKGSHLNRNLNGTEAFASLGFHLGYAKYRLATEEKPSYAAVLWDVQRAITHMRAQGVEDVTIVGTSAGANLALLSTMHYSKKYAAGGSHQPADRMVLMYGIYDYTTAETDLSEPVQGMLKQYIGPRSGNAASMRLLSPVNMDLPDMPALIIHGEDDTVVSVNQSIALKDAYGDGAELHTLPGQHGMAVVGFLPEIAQFIASSNRT